MKQFRRTGMALVLVLVLMVGPAVVYALSDGSVENSAAASFLGEAEFNSAGYDVAGAGDVNGDGYSDLLIGAIAADGTGAAYLVLGKPDGWGLGKGLGQSQIIQYSGEVSGDQAGFSVDGAGDVNGDGYGDLIIGAYSNDDGGTSAGAAYLVLGSATPTSANLSTAIQYSGESAFDNAGISVAGAGDVNGDGYSDLLIGAPGDDDTNTDTGAAYLVLGSPTIAGGNLSSVIKYRGFWPNELAGSSVAGAGDVNGDGYGDMLIGAPNNSIGEPMVGLAYLVLGSATPTGGNLSSTIVYRGEAANNYAGQSVAGAGDVNGDGYADMLIGAYGNSAGGSAAGAAYLVLGGPSPLSPFLSDAIRYTGEAALDLAGYSVSGAGDVNGDGYSDMLIGAYQHDDGGLEAGAAYLVLGSSTIPGGVLWTAIQYAGKAAGDNAGVSVGRTGDANGDGYSDLLVGAYQNSDSGTGAGAAYLILSDALNSHTPSYRQRQRLSGSGDTLPVLFEQAGVWVDFTAGAQSGSDISVTRHAFHPCATDNRLQMPIWTVESPKMTAGAVVDLRFKYSDMNIRGMNEANLAVWTRPGGDPCGAWTEVALSTVDADHNRITAEGLTSLSQFTISEGTPNPTAVREPTMGLVLAQEPLWLVGLLALLVVTAGATYWYLRQQGMVVREGAVPADVAEAIADKVAERLKRP
jgi:hypothetical protein